MTKTIETKIKQITPWIFADSNERFSHLEMYFAGEGKNSYRETRGTRQQIFEQLKLDSSKSLDSNLHSLIGKKVRITKDMQTGFISDVQIMPPAHNTFYSWLGWNKEVPEYC